MQQPADNRWHFFIYILLMQWQTTEQQLEQLKSSLQECLGPEDFPLPTILKSVYDLTQVKCNNTNLNIIQSNFPKLYNNSFISLPNLTRLSLRNNSIQDIETEAFWPMKDLIVLDLGENRLNNISTTVFKLLQHLRHLYLDNNRLINLDCVAQLTKLQLLDASYNQLSDKLTCIPVLPKLIILRLRNANIKKTFTNNMLSHFENICELDLTNNRLTVNNLQMSLRSINVKNIRILNLGNEEKLQTSQQTYGMNKFPEIASNVFPQLPNLHVLDLSQTEIRSLEPTIQCLFPELKVLLLKSNGLNEIPDWIVNSSLEHLDLSNNGIGKWSNAKYLPNLKHLNLYRNLITNLDSANKFQAFPRLKSLNLSNNNMGNIAPYSFTNLKYLETLDISNNTLTVIQNNTFSGLQSLKTLNLERNNLMILRENQPFENLYNLTILNFRYNTLCDIWTWVLPDQVNLEVLDFSYNKIETWSEFAFQNTKKLRILNLRRNGIKKFTPTMLKELSEEHFEIIDLSENEFNCSDCSMNYLKDWLKIKTKQCYELNQLNTEESDPCSVYKKIKCINSDKKLVSLDFENFPVVADCNEDNEDNSHFKYICGAVTTFVVVIIIAIVMYCWRWHLKYYWYMCFGCQCLAARQSLDESYEYSAYISYCEADRLWLQNIFLPRLENRQTNLNFYVLERDFVPGRYMIENIMEGLEKSRSFVVLLSKEYLRNGWRNWEFNWAACRLASQAVPGSPKIVILNLGRVSDREMTPTMRSVTQTQLYYKWSHGGPRQRLIWEKLGQTLEKNNINNNNSNEEEDQNTSF